MPGVDHDILLSAEENYFLLAVAILWSHVLISIFSVQAVEEVRFSSCARTASSTATATAR